MTCKNLKELLQEETNYFTGGAKAASEGETIAGQLYKEFMQGVTEDIVAQKRLVLGQVRELAKQASTGKLEVRQGQ